VVAKKTQTHKHYTLTHKTYIHK